jgi:hypothetical protein
MRESVCDEESTVPTSLLTGLELDFLRSVGAWSNPRMMDLKEREKEKEFESNGMK